MYNHLPKILVLLALVFSQAAIPAGEKPRNLLVTVLQTSDENEARALLAPEPHIADAGVNPVPATIYRSRGHPDKNSTRQLRVIEGRTAFIQIGKRRPDVRLLWVEADGDNPKPNIGLAGREHTGGFTVSATLADERVILQVQHYSETSQATQALATTVSGRIGQWLDLGGSLVIEDIPAGITAYSVSGDHNGRMRVLARVELAR